MPTEAFQTHVINKLEKLDDEIGQIDKKIEVGIASFPAQYISRNEYVEHRKEAVRARRYALTSLISSLGILAGIMVFVVG